MLLLFNNGMHEKRRFVDRLVNIIDPEHVSYLCNYEALIKERLKVINNYNYDNIWLNTIESKIIKLSIKIINNRKNLLSKMKNNCISFSKKNTWFHLSQNYERLYDKIKQK